MEVGDENLPPTTNSWTSPTVCASASFPPASTSSVRSVLSDINVSLTETKCTQQELVSFHFAIIKCQQLSCFTLKFYFYLLPRYNELQFISNKSTA